MPLKVILLAASSGVPRYFPFIDPAHKTPWIIGLSIAAFVAYGLTLLLEAIAERLSEGASTDVLEGANEMAVSSNQHAEAQQAYSSFCRAYASLAFVIVSGGVLGLLKPELLTFVAGAVLVQYWMTAWALRRPEKGRFDGITAWIRNRLGGYLEFNSSVIFLLGFLILLAPYLLGSGDNVLLTILSLIAFRQMLGEITSIPKTAVKLTKQRASINALVFHDQPRQSKEKPIITILREQFAKAERQAKGHELLADVTGAETATDVAWMDSPRGFINTLTLGPVSEGDGHQPHYYQQQIFVPKARAFLENESFLFRHVERQRLHAPARLARYEQEPFECQLLEYGTGQPVPPQQWKSLYDDLLTDTLGCQPPARLVAAYRKSRLLLHERIDEQLLDRISIAVDADDEERALAALRTKLPVLQQRIGDLPLCIDNQDIKPDTSALATDGSPLLMIWARWSLEPFGATQFGAQDTDRIIELHPRIARQRTDLKAPMYGEDVALAALCRQLETRDTKTQFKAAVADTVPAIVANLETERTALA
ncbi:MAG: hypothetical protein FKY71_18135, partial [Spiribacter salinus]